MSVVACRILVTIVGATGKERVFDFPNSGLGANGELEVFALQRRVSTLNIRAYQ